MDARNSYTFVPEVPATFFCDNTTIVLGNYNFTVEFWQPFIDVTKEYRISGPLFSALIEIARVLRISLTFFDDSSDDFIPNELIDTKELHIILTLFPPMSINDSGVVKNLRLSQVVGDISMLSILSAKRPSANPMFRLMRIFSPEIWILIVLMYFMVTFVCHYLWSLKLKGSPKEETIFIDFIGIVFRQSIKNLDRQNSQASIIMIWYLAAFILSSAFSGALLSFLVFSKPFKTIDSINDLAESDIKIVVFVGENSNEYFNDTSEPNHYKFEHRIRQDNPENSKQDEWETELFNKIDTSQEVLVSDQAYLDYQFATKLHNFTNLYRSKQNQLVMPYFIPLTRHVHQDQRVIINRILANLLEGGIFELWTKETIFRNNKDRGNYHDNDYLHMKYQYKPLAFEHFFVIFVLSFISLNLGIIILIIELTFMKWKNRNKFFRKRYRLNKYIIVLG